MKTNQVSVNENFNTSDIKSSILIKENSIQTDNLMMDNITELKREITASGNVQTI